MHKKIFLTVFSIAIILSLTGCSWKEKIYIEDYINVSRNCNINQYATLKFELDSNRLVETIGKEKIENALKALNPEQYQSMIDEGKQIDLASLFVLEEDTAQYVKNGDEITLKLADTPGLSSNANIHFMRRLGIEFEGFTYIVESLNELKVADLSEFLLNNLYFYGHTPKGMVKIQSTPGEELYKDESIKIVSNEKGYSVFDKNGVLISTSYVEVENKSTGEYFETLTENIANGDILQFHVREHEVMEMAEYGYLVFASSAITEVNQLSTIITSIEEIPYNLEQLLSDAFSHYNFSGVGKAYFGVELDKGVQEFPYVIFFDYYYNAREIDGVHYDESSSAVKVCNPYIDTDGTLQYDAVWEQPEGDQYTYGEIGDYYAEQKQSYALEEIELH